MNNDIEDILTKAKELLKGEMTQISYTTWIEPLGIDNIDGNKIILISNDPFKTDQIVSRYHDLIVNTFNLILQKQCTLSFVSDKDGNSVTLNATSPIITNPNSSLNPKYSFSTFVVGDNNRFAHAASLAVAEAPRNSI